MKEIYFTKVKSSKLIELEDKDLSDWLKDNFDFEICYIPEGYSIAFLLIKQEDNPLKDIWQIVFYKKAKDFSNSEIKAITLDNMDDLNEIEDQMSYQIVKSIKTNFEGVIETSREIIENHGKKILKIMEDL